MENIIRNYAEMVGIPMDDLLGKSRKEVVSEKRRAVWYKLKQEDGLSYKQIARLFGRNGQSSVVHGIRTVKELMSVRYRRTQEILDNLNCNY